MTSSIEIIDKMDLADYANSMNGIQLGEIPLQFETIMDYDFLLTIDGEEVASPDRIAYGGGEHTGSAGFYDAEQGLSAVMSAIGYCLANHEDGLFSDFIIPISATDRLYLYITIGSLE